MIPVIIALVIIALIVILTRNGMIAARNGIENAKGGLDAMLKKRYDLIPNLISTVQQHSKYESDTLARLVELRSKGMNGALTANEQQEFSNQYNTLGKSFLALSENYPALMASESYLELQGSLNENEEQIAAARRTYNAAINVYNNRIQQFPGSLFASGMQMYKVDTPTISENESKNVNVKDLFNS
jgi:LemA protein